MNTTTITYGTNGRIYWTDAKGVATRARCSWLVDHGYNEDGDPIILECDAPFTALDDDGWECEAGHQHFTYGTAACEADNLEFEARERRLELVR